MVQVLMDDLKLYIKMCEKAVEIQKLLDKTLPYNIVFCPHCNDIRYTQWDSFCWREEYGNGSKLQEWTSCYDTSDHPEFHGNKVIWLPRQDQLQKMVLKKYKKGFRRNNTEEGYPISFVEDFAQFVRCCVAQNYDSVKWSMEQLWLAFVMKEKYGKIWNGEDWCKEKE